MELATMHLVLMWERKAKWKSRLVNSKKYGTHSFTVAELTLVEGVKALRVT
jgi:hypothetical protein